MSVDIRKIATALADTIRQGVERPVNVYPNPVQAPSFPAVVIVPADVFIIPFGTFGPNQLVQVNFNVLIGGTGRPEDAWSFIYSMLSMGSDQVDSVLDVLSSAKSNLAATPLAGLVESMGYDDFSTDITGDVNADVYVGRLPVQFQARR